MTIVGKNLLEYTCCQQAIPHGYLRVFTGMRFKIEWLGKRMEIDSLEVTGKHWTFVVDENARMRHRSRSAHEFFRCRGTRFLGLCGLSRRGARGNSKARQRSVAEIFFTEIFTFAAAEMRSISFWIAFIDAFSCAKTSTYNNCVRDVSWVTNKAKKTDIFIRKQERFSRMTKAKIFT